MKNFTRLIFALFISALSLFPDRAEASHLKGGDTYFVSVGNGQYELVFACYYACTPASIGYDTTAADFTWTLTSSCASVPATITAVSSTPPRDVPLYCPGVLTQCDYYSQQLEDSTGLPYANAPANAPVGTLVIVYRSAPFSIPPGCTVSATMDFSARNADILNLVNPGGDAINIVANITTPASGAANNNPQFAQYPVNIFCLGRNANFSQGAIDLNGDSLTYTLVNPQSFGGVAAAFVTGCNATNPLGVGNGTGFASSFSFDSTNGNVNFTPTATGDFVLAVQVNDYHNGVLVGTTMRDIQFTVVLCNNTSNPPVIGGGFTTTNVTGATVIDSNHIGVCPGEQVHITLTSTDIDSFSYIIDTTNVIQSLPGSTVSVTHTGTTFDTATMHITWTPALSDSGFHYFLVTTTDTFCPNPGRNTYSFIVSVITGVYAGPNLVYCNGGQPVTIHATGANHYLWTDSTTGGPPVGVLSYGPDSSYIVVAPGVTSGYVVTGDLPSTCRNSDTVKVVNAPIFSLTATAADSSICKYTTTTITTTPSPAGVGPFTYSWTPVSGVVSPTSGSTLLTPILSTTMFYVKVTAAGGCAISDSVQVSVNGAAPRISILPSDNNVCPGDTVTLNTAVYAENLVLCGTVDTCVTNNNLVSVAVNNDTASSTGGQFGTAVYCSPFMGSINSYKAQYLFTKAELNAAGLSSGSITDISFFVKQVLSTAPYDTFTVSMGCTDQDSLTYFLNNLVEVVPPQMGPNAITPNQGWTPLPFTHFYNWDGASNLVIQICYTIDPSINSQDDYVSYTTTSYTGSSIIAGDYNFFGPPAPPNGCSLDQSANLYTLLNTRPNIKFGQCVPNVLAYHWAPATLICDTCPTTRVIVNANSSYSLTVSDGLCSNSTSTQLTINPNIGAAATPAVASYCGGNGVQLNVGLTNPPVSQCIDGYTVTSIPFSPINGTATMINPSSYLDQFGFSSTEEATAGPLNIGFTFPFYCDTFSQFYVNTDGWISFLYPYPINPPAQEYTACSFPTTSATEFPLKTIDLVMGGYVLDDSFGFGGGNVSYFVTGTAPSRVLVIQFNDMQDFSGLDTTSGEMHLYEGTGVIDILIKYSDYAGTQHTTGINDSVGLGIAAPGMNNQFFVDSVPVAWRFTPIHGPSVAIISTVWSPNQNLSSDTITNPIASPTTPQTYIVTDTLVINQFTNPTKCVVKDTVHVNISHFGGDTLTASPGVVCAGSNSQLTFTAQDPIVSYSWRPASGLSDSVIADPTATVSDTTKYYVTVVSAAGCIVTDSITIDAVHPPTVSLPASVSSCNCTPAVVVAPTVTGGAPAYTYQWSDGSTGATTTDTTVGSVIYTLTVTDANHCTVVSNTDTFAMHCPRATISVAPASDTIFLHDTAVLTVTPVVGYTYLWTGDTTTNVLAPAANVTPVIGLITGQDTIHLLVTDGYGCTYSTTQVINVLEFGNFALATAFTPNGDGKNDFFYPVLEGPVTISKFNIYDRWGQQVFDNSDPRGWDGTYKGKQEPTETYIYFITFEYPDPNDASRTVQRSVQGSFQLFR